MAVLPFVALLVLLLWQLAVAGQAAWLAGSAARAAARAHAIGHDAAAGARAVLPPDLDEAMRVRLSPGGAVAVTIGVPSVVGSAVLGSVEGNAQFEPQSP